MLTHAAPSGHRALRPHLGREEGSGKGRPPCGERHVSDAPLCGRVSWKKLRKSQAALRIQNTCLLRRGPHFRKLSRAVVRVYLSQVGAYLTFDLVRSALSLFLQREFCSERRGWFPHSPRPAWSGARGCVPLGGLHNRRPGCREARRQEPGMAEPPASSAVLLRVPRALSL